ncbi:MAG: hypothetical protein KZQ98_02760 [Candidatus Thiodiazotropha sp. (ex Lucinoma borealis)]|nr:hypothetical protein [Candidatus Thiodiazotropha sp. (ex Lucinoma borealis)]
MSQPNDQKKNPPFRVTHFSLEILIELITESCVQKLCASKKSHIRYFHDYLKHIGASTILVEYDYTDRDFLEDYASYYIRCFFDYDRRCTRLHFFESVFEETSFNELLSGAEDLDPGFFQDSYLGFMVLKSLPKTVIGRTCLNTYPKTDGRFFPIRRKYKVNLFGLKLYLEKALAFQEQDSVVAACATSALWSAFHGAHRIFLNAIPSPVEITKAATEKFPPDSRSFPNRGLDHYMMAHAIRTVSLEPFKLSAVDPCLLKGSIYGYLKAGIPTILGYHIYGNDSVSRGYVGTHAVTVAGFSLSDEGLVPADDKQIQLKAFRMNKIYVHDDQIGPYARMCFDGESVSFHTGKSTTKRVSLSTEVLLEGDIAPTSRALPAILLIPLYHKIRIPFESVYACISGFDEYLRAMPEDIQLDLFNDLEWDIHLTTVNDLKSRFFEIRSTFTNTSLIRKTLLDRMPKYIWRATCYDGDTPLLDLLFDATDIEQGDYFLRCVDCSSELFAFLTFICANTTNIEGRYSCNLEWPILRWFREQGLKQQVNLALENA